jgi:hypothetical protein
MRDIRALFRTFSTIQRIAISIIDDGLDWLFRDDFLNNLSPGTINSTDATTGPGARTVTDTNNVLSINNGTLIFSTGGVTNGNPGIWYPTAVRQFMKTLIGRVNIPSLTAEVSIGWDSNNAGVLSQAFRFTAGGNLRIYDNGTQILVGSFTIATFDIALVQRTTSGDFYLIKGGTYTNWTLIYVSSAFTGVNSIFPAMIANTATSIATFYPIGVVVVTSLTIAPVAYDSFTRSNGVLGSTETTGPDGQTTQSLAWQDTLGTWGVASNVAQCSALSGGSGIATYDCGKTNVLHDGIFTRSGGNTGMVVRYVDANNYITCYHDGTSLKVDKIVGGVLTNVITQAVTYSATALMRIVIDGTNVRVFYGSTTAAGTIADAGLQTGTRVGIYTTNVGNTADRVTTWARGSNGEYARLDDYIQH